MVYPIVKFPDPILQRPAEPVTVFDEDLKKLVDDMFESMYIAHGIGLAAPQIGIPKRLTVIDLSFQKTPEDKIALINPEVVTKGGLSQPSRHSRESGARREGQNTCPGCAG
jgi:peptide deformylase